MTVKMRKKDIDFTKYVCKMCFPGCKLTAATEPCKCPHGSLTTDWQVKKIKPLPTPKMPLSIKLNVLANAMEVEIYGNLKNCTEYKRYCESIIKRLRELDEEK